MIIQIRGTSGSGKSTVMKAVMHRLATMLGQPEVQYVTGRKRPGSYFYNGLVYVLGAYETACGGCDGIGSARAVYDLIQRMMNGPDNARVILCEGLLLSEDTKWSLQLPDLRCVFLTTPVEECLRRIRARRAEAGNVKPLNEDNTRKRVAVIERARVKMEAAGVVCRRASSTQAPRIVTGWVEEGRR